MTGEGEKVWDFFHFGVLPRKAPPWNSRGAWNSPLRGRGRLPNWRKDLKILILFHSFLFNFRIQDGRGLSRKTRLDPLVTGKKGPVPSSGRDLGGSLICELGFAS